MGQKASAIIHAAKHGDLPTLLKHVHQLSEIRDAESHESVLYWSAHYGHLKCVEFLVATNPQLLRTGPTPPLVAACAGGHLSVVSFLIEKDSESARITDARGMTPLHAACRSGHYSTVTLLIDKCPESMRMMDNSGRTPLHYACQEDHLDVVFVLLSVMDLDLAKVMISKRLKQWYSKPVNHLIDEMTANRRAIQEGFVDALFSQYRSCILSCTATIGYYSHNVVCVCVCV